MVVDDPVDSEPTVNQPVSTLPDAPQLEFFDSNLTGSSVKSTVVDHGIDIINSTIAIAYTGGLLCLEK